MPNKGMIVKAPLIAVKYNQSKGSILLESLIATVIISIALIGMAKTMTLSLGDGQDAAVNTRAISLMYDMTDRVRANMDGYALGQYNNLATKCTETCNRAQLDYNDWLEGLKRELPDGKGIVCLDGSPEDGLPSDPACSGSGSLVVKVWWQGKATVPVRLTLPFKP